MERLLSKLARQLDSMDEASLMSLWDKYAAIVRKFEPSKRWEEAVMIFSLLQAKHWKNQLFNYQWACRQRPQAGEERPPAASAFSLDPPSGSLDGTAQKRCQVLRFRSIKRHETA